jgi:hypothetical protein
MPQIAARCITIARVTRRDWGGRWMYLRLPEFEVLVDMARNDPDGLEALRRRLCNRVIEQAAPAQRRRLRGLQFQVDMERRRAGTPLGALIRIYAMMHVSLAQLALALNAPTPYVRRQATRGSTPTTARVLPIARR